MKEFYFSILSQYLRNRNKSKIATAPVIPSARSSPNEKSPSTQRTGHRNAPTDIELSHVPMGKPIERVPSRTSSYNLGEDVAKDAPGTDGSEFSRVKDDPVVHSDQKELHSRFRKSCKMSSQFQALRLSLPKTHLMRVKN